MAKTPNKTRPNSPNPEERKSEESNTVGRDESALHRSATHRGNGESAKAMGRTSSGTDAASSDSHSPTRERLQSATDARDEARHKARKLSLPERVSRYRTEALLGKGAFGMVLLAHDPRLDRQVAVKLQLNRSIRDSHASIDRFQREARSAAQLRHPGIVPVFEFGDFADSQYIVYQFIDGKTLDRWVAETHPDRRQIAETIAGVAEALDYAHRLGVIHRDIKPANILIDEHDRPHVADFGCAKIEAADILETVEGAVLGTPAYMSPEVVTGRAREADGRADIWALGVMLYEFLVDERPFSGSIPEMFHQIAQGSVRPPRRIDRSVPVELETICLKCLALRPADRYAHAGDLAQDLKNWLNGFPVAARKPGPLGRLVKWSRRQPLIASLTALLFVALLSIAIVSWMFQSRLRDRYSELVDSLVANLTTAESSALPLIYEGLDQLDPAVVNSLSATEDDSPVVATRLSAARILATSSDADLDALIDGIPQAAMGDLVVFAEVLSQPLADRADRFWDFVAQRNHPYDQRMRVLCLLATLCPEDARWTSQADQLPGYLLGLESDQVPVVMTLLRPLRRHLQPRLEGLRDGADSEVSLTATRLLAHLMVDDLDPLLDAIADSSARQLRAISSIITTHRESVLRWATSQEPADADLVRRAQLLMIQSISGNPEGILEQYRNPGRDPTLQHILVTRSGPANVPSEPLVTWLRDPQTSADVVFFSLLALGSYDQRQFYQTERQALAPRILELFATHPDAGVHSAARWLLQRWGFAAELADVVTSLRRPQPEPGLDWHEDTTGICFSLLPVDDNNGATANLAPASVTEPRARRIGVATTEVPADDFLNWEAQLIDAWEAAGSDADASWADRAKRLRRNRLNRDSASTRAPMTNVTWHEAALYCNGLSQLANVERDQFAYDIRYGTSEFQARVVDRDGPRHSYRLPTGQEWAKACLAGSAGPWGFGPVLELADAWTWNVNNSGDRPQPVSTRLPNRYGLFDMQGNVQEWCHNRHGETTNAEAQTGLPCEIRDQSCAELPTDFDAGRATQLNPDRSLSRLGFRVVRIYSTAD